MDIDIESFKKAITIDKVYQLLTYLHAEPERRGNIIISKTICHHPENELGEADKKLYYYQNGEMGIFHCYTHCSPASFDVLELIIKVQAQKGVTWTMIDAAKFLNNYFALDFEKKITTPQEQLQDWQYLSKWNKDNLVQQEQKADFKVYDDSFLQHFPRPRILNWEREGITQEVCAARNICYDPKNDGIIIPHYNIDGELIGVRERTLIKDEEVNGKYRPAYIDGKLWNHPLGFNLYNLNWSKENIKRMKTAIVFEGEKSCLQFASYFGSDNDITCAICGSNFSNHQFNLLASLKVNEIVIALDKQYQTDSGDDWAKWTRKFIEIFNKYGKYVQVSFIVDRQGLLEYKDSPTDKGKVIFLHLYSKRETIRGGSS